LEKVGKRKNKGNAKKQTPKNRIVENTNAKGFFQGKEIIFKKNLIL
jgi:hypothetical protein